MTFAHYFAHYQACTHTQYARARAHAHKDMHMIATHTFLTIHVLPLPHSVPLPLSLTLSYTHSPPSPGSYFQPNLATPEGANTGRVTELGDAVFALLHGRATASHLRAIEEALDHLQNSRWGSPCNPEVH